MGKSGMTQRERKERARAKKELQEKGLIPPDKPRLNRKRFVKEAQKDLEQITLDDLIYLYQGASIMLPQYRPGPEHVGVAKAVKIAAEIKRFMAEKREQGQDSYRYGELYERLEPILKA